MTKKILVAIDGSKRSDDVLQYAATLAKTTASKVVILYVVPEYKIARDEYPVPKGSPWASTVGDIAERIVADAENLFESKGIESEGCYEFGNPSLKILEAAESEKASLIVVGLTGLHGIGRIRALGSVARRVIENSKVPVVAVP